jgi:ketosteroid isomerase-like protein
MFTFVLCSVLALAAKPTMAVPLPASEIALIEQTHAATEAMVKPDADWDAWAAAHYAPDAMLLPPNGPAVQGRKAIAEYLASFPPITHFEVVDLDVVGAGDLAYIRGTYDMTLSPPDGPSFRDVGKYIEIWRRQADGSWRCSADIFNSDVAP